MNDVFWGPGNYVVIQHSDRTISAYDHMHPFSLQVTAGQYVNQGAWLGNVGNTGSTSGGVVHVHFECHSWFQVGSTGPGSIINNIAGPSLMIHLEDENQSAWRPLVGEPVSPFPVVSRQDGWRWCEKCGGLYFSCWDVPGGLVPLRQVLGDVLFSQFGIEVSGHHAQ